MVNTFSNINNRFLLSTAKEWYTRKKQEQEEKEGAKALIELEIKRNKELLEDFWEAVSKSNKKWFYENTGFSYSHLASSIIEITLPNFSDEAWKSQLNEVPKVYDKEKIEDLWKSYDYFQQLREIRNQIAIQDEQAEARVRSMQDQGNVYATLGYLGFGEKTSHLAKNFRIITEKLIGENTVIFKNVEEAKSES